MKENFPPESPAIIAARETREKARAELARQGILCGPVSLAPAEKVVAVNSGNIGFAVREPTAAAAFFRAAFESTDGSAIVQHFPIFEFCGVEFLRATKKAFGVLPQAEPYYTDSRGIVVPPAEVLARMGALPTALRADAPVRVWVDCKDEPSQSPAARRFAHLRARENAPAPAPAHESSAREIARDEASVEKRAKKRAAVLAARKPAREVFPVGEPTRVEFPPARIGSPRELAALARKRARKIPAVSPEAAARIAAHQAEIARLSGLISENVAEQKKLRPGTLVPAPSKNGRYEFSEIAKERLREKAREFRVLLTWERDALAETK